MGGGGARVVVLTKVGSSTAASGQRTCEAPPCLLRESRVQVLKTHINNRMPYKETWHPSRSEGRGLGPPVT